MGFRPNHCSLRKAAQHGKVEIGRILIRHGVLPDSIFACHAACASQWDFKIRLNTFLKIKKNVSYQKVIMKTNIKSSMLASLGKKILFHHILAFHSSPLRIGRPRSLFLLYS
jgi:hypothetical protein